VKPLDGWPSDPGAFIARHLADIAGTGWGVGRV